MATQLRGFPEINLSSCCLCFSARTGSLIMGYVSWISSMIAAGLYILYLLILTAGIFSSPENIGVLILFWFATLILFGLTMLMVMISRKMINGVKENNPSLMIPFIYFNCAFFVLGILMNIIMIFDNPLPGDQVVAYFCGLIIGSVIGAYFLLVVVSHCQKLIAMERHGLPVNVLNV